MTEAMFLSSSQENGKYGIPLKRAVTTGLVRVATDQCSAGFVPWKHLWSQMNAPMVSPARATLTGGDVIWGACQSWPESFSHQKRTEEKQEAIEERKFFHPSCPFKERENLPWLTWTHLASLANRKRPLQLFFQWRMGLAPFHGKGQMLHTIFTSDFWPENKNWHCKCPMILSNLPWHSMAGPGGTLFVLFKWLYSCCCVPRLNIRTYWPFFQECRALKRQRGRLQRKN